MSTGQTPTVRYPVTRRRRRRHPARRWFVALFAIIVIAIVLVIGDRVASAVAENTIAGKIQSSGFPVKPGVTITGFPFLTQVAARDIHQIDISASNVPAGPLQLSSVTAVAAGVQLNSSFNGGTVDRVNGTALVTFAALAGAATGGAGAGNGSGLTLAAAGPDKVKITAGTGPLSGTEYAQVSQSGPSKINVRVLSGGAGLSGILSSFGSFSFDVPKLPAGLRVTGVSVTAQGLRITASAHDTQLSE
jgi:hypothetical protein